MPVSMSVIMAQPTDDYNSAPSRQVGRQAGGLSGIAYLLCTMVVVEYYGHKAPAKIRRALAVIALRRTQSTPASISGLNRDSKMYHVSCIIDIYYVCCVPVCKSCRPDLCIFESSPIRSRGCSLSTTTTRSYDIGNTRRLITHKPHAYI